MLRYSFLLICLGLCVSPDVPHSRVIDDFRNPERWVAEVINSQQYGPLFHVGVWSDPLKGPAYSVENGKAYFHFPRLESWQVQGFEYAYHMDHNNKAFPLLDSVNYLCFNVTNQSAEPVQFRFRLLEDMTYFYSGSGESTHEDAMAEMMCSPDTVILKPHVLQKVKMKLTHTALSHDIILLAYSNQVRFFAFEVKRTIASSKAKSTLDCTVVMDNLRIQDR